MALFEFMNQGGQQSPGNQGAGNGTENITSNTLREILGDLVVGFSSGFKALLSAVKYGFTSFGSSIQETASGVLVFFDGAGTSFNRICLGGTTNAFPALGRSGGLLNARVADDSGYTSVRMLSASLTGAATADGTNLVLGNTTATTATAGANGAVPAQVVGYIIANLGGTTVKIPYFAN